MERIWGHVRLRTLICLLACLTAGNRLLAQDKPILFQHVRVFDGDIVIPVADVLIKDGKIVAIDSTLSAPDASVVDGTGKTLLPGFIDAHVHVHSRESLEQALVFRGHHRARHDDASAARV